MGDKLEEALESQSLRELLEDESFIMGEGIFDWLFKRWRKGGTWKGNKYGEKQGTMIEVFIKNLEEIYRSMGPMHSEYPRKTKLIRANLLRAIRDMEDLLISVERGRTEKDVDDEFPIK
jgi:hypothetical protein